MNNHTKQILTLMLGFTLFGGMVGSILGMEPIEPTREEFGGYSETESFWNSPEDKQTMWANASSAAKNAIWDRANSEERYQILTKIAPKKEARRFMAETFKKKWFELEKMKKNILKLTGNDLNENQFFQNVYNAILEGTFDETMLLQVDQRWGRIFEQYKKTLAPPNPPIQYYMPMIRDESTPLGKVASAYNTQLNSLLTFIINVEKDR